MLLKTGDQSRGAAGNSRPGMARNDEELGIYLRWGLGNCGYDGERSAIGGSGMGSGKIAPGLGGARDHKN